MNRVGFEISASLDVISSEIEYIRVFDSTKQLGHNAQVVLVSAQVGETDYSQSSRIE